MKTFLSFILLAAFLAAGAHAAPEDDVVVDFYRWYLRALDESDHAEAMKSPRIHAYVTDHLLERIKLQAKRIGLDGGADYDPFLMSQGVDKEWENNIRIVDSRQDGSTRTVQVSMNGRETGAHRLTLTLAQEYGKWKIDDVSDGSRR